MINKNTNYIDKNNKVFQKIASSLSNNNIEIIEALDNIGGYYEDKIILPKDISILNDDNLKKQIYIYKLIYSIISNKLNYYYNFNNKNTSLLFISSLLTVKRINRIMDLSFYTFKKNKKIIYKNILKTRTKIGLLVGNKFILECILLKLMYKYISDKINLSIDERYIIYIIENIIYIDDKNLKFNTDKIHKKLSSIHKDDQNIEFNILWGYLYKKINNKSLNTFKKDLKNSENDNDKNTDENPSNKIIKYKNIKDKNNTNLSNLFDYKKTVDKFTKGNKNIDDKNSNNLDILNKIDMEYSIKTNGFSKKNYNIKILNNITFMKDNFFYSFYKKYAYKEWDFSQNNYKNDWCYIYEKKINFDKSKLNNNIDQIINNEKKHLVWLKNKIHSIINEKIWKYKLNSGNNIDIDSLIDNYKESKNNTYFKLYKNKNKIRKNLCLVILFDSSFSTDGFIQNKKIILILQYITILISEVMNSLAKYLCIASFNSNTRYNCQYFILKDFTDDWNKKKYNINMISSGYTRIGPAIRHTISKIKKIKIRDKIIILLTDGKPTDYDEYEGIYGINDIKKSIEEAKKHGINIKSIILNNNQNDILLKMFGKKNFYNLDISKNIYIQLFKILSNILN
jgi:nitric oxide reductase NorD protein